MAIDFRKPYKSEEFVNFLGDFLPDDFEQTTELININDLSFKPDKIKKVKMLGNVPSLEDLRVYEIEHESESDPRVILSRETFRLMSNYGARKALAIFISMNSRNFRFSLATIELKLEGSRVTKDYSNPRRYSFFLGPDAKIHTPTKYLITNGRIKDLSDLQNRFSIEVVTKEFFGELSNWYFWALKNIEYPKDVEKEKNGKNIFTIRLITRLIFIWFMKQKKLIPENLFDCDYLKSILKDLSPNKTTYYKAILQNLFFATLNTQIKDRDFRTDETHQGKNKDFMNHNVYRYHKLFINPEDMKSVFNNIPFLNGGLFECLDRIEDKGKYIRIDGFSDREDSQANAPNSLFFSEERVVDLRKDYGPEEKYKKCRVRGIINLLQTYNFTIDESTPVDVEIALDPELLGRVFENLLASYNPETATTARKATGSYYTPREIVDYMVTQSLKEYFKTKLQASDTRLQTEDIDDKLNNLLSYDFDENPFNENETDTLINSVNALKIIDPAVGSGAFPMGILQKLVLVLSKLDLHNEKWKQQQISAIENNVTDVITKRESIEKVEQNFQKNELDYGRKLYLIQNCIYGVDIKPIAIQIAKLRFFISLLVDETHMPTIGTREDGNVIPAKAGIHFPSGFRVKHGMTGERGFSEENYGIEPLPNLELKFISANSLIGLNSQKQLEFKDSNITKLEEDLKRVREIYFRTSDTKQKEKLRKEDKELRDKISSLLKNNILNPDDSKKISDWDPYNSNKSANWFDPEWMFGVKDGFDVAIANPPYIGEKGYKEIFDPVHSGNLKKYYQGQMDLFYFFFHLALNLGKQDSSVAFITTNYYPTATGARNLRIDFSNRATIKQLINFGELKIFKSALGQHNMITILQKENNKNAIAKTCITKRNGDSNSEILQAIVDGTDTQTDYFKVAQGDLYDGEEYYIRLAGNSMESNDPPQSTINKIRQQGVLLSMLCNVNVGLYTGADKVSNNYIQKYSLKMDKNEGIFIITREEMKMLDLNSLERSKISSFYKNSDIFRWYTKQNPDLFLINISYPENKNIDLKKIPNIFRHISKYEKILRNRKSNDNGLRAVIAAGYWWSFTIRQIDFNMPKIVVPQRSPRNTFGYNEISWYASADVYFITEKDKSVSLKYILAILNSKLYYLWLYHRGKRKGEMLELYQQPLSEIPIKKISRPDQKPFIEIVDKILAITKSSDYLENPAKKEEVKELEHQIDQMVYKLYGLTEEEIAIVEGNK